MAKKTYLEKQEEAADEAQAVVGPDSEATPEQEMVQQAQAARHSFHAAKGRNPAKAWDELSEAKRQRWLDAVTA